MAGKKRETKRFRIFREQYLATGNAFRAALAAGYSPRMAKSKSYRLAQRVDGAGGVHSEPESGQHGGEELPAAIPQNRNKTGIRLRADPAVSQNRCKTDTGRADAQPPRKLLGPMTGPLARRNRRSW